MAQPKPIPISATPFPAVKVTPELRAGASRPERLAQEPGAFPRCMDRAFLLMLIGPSAPSGYRLLDAEPLIEMGLENLLVQDVDVESVLVHGLQPLETLVRAVLEERRCWAFRPCKTALSQQTSHRVEAALRRADALVDLPVQQILAGLHSRVRRSGVS